MKELKAHLKTLQDFQEHLFDEGAQERFEAAMKFLETQTTGFYNSDNNLIYLEDCTDVQTALQIAAGLKPNE